MNMKNERCPLQAECERRCSFYGREKECDYPMAADMKKSLEEQLAGTQAAQAAPAPVVPAETQGGAGLTGGAGDILPTGGEVTA